MHRHAVAAILFLIAAAAFAQVPAAAPKPQQLGLCAACHGENGIAAAKDIPNLAGQNEAYLVSALKQYRSGERKASAMRAVSGALSEADIAALARWYAGQPAGGTPQR